jgi:hypothetical protein
MPAQTCYNQKSQWESSCWITIRRYRSHWITVRRLGHAGNIPLAKELGAHKYENLAADIVHLIESGTFREGDRIPSVRQLSHREGVSVTTVLQAYYLLEAQGWIEARPRSGFFVRSPLRTALPEPDISSPELDPTQVSVWELVLMVLRDTLNPALVQLGAGPPHPPPPPPHQPQPPPHLHRPQYGRRQRPL